MRVVKARRALREERGSVLLIVVLALPVILAITAFAVDIASILVARHQAQVAADAGALAGAQDVVTGSDGTSTIDGPTATAHATTYATTLNDPGATATVTAPYGSDSQSVKVVVNQQVPLHLAGLFGISSASVSASAVATADTFSRLGYFGSDSSGDLQDGSTNGDGWDNFCANDYSFSESSNYDSYSTSDSTDPKRCPQSGSPTNNSLDGWVVAHGGVDVASTTQFSSPPGTNYQMVDLTGTCVEQIGTYPSGSGYTQVLPGANNDNYGGNGDGYCENNADGTIEQSIATVPGDQYTVNFWLGANTWGWPYEKSLMVVASNEDLAGQPSGSPDSLPPIADTNGNDASGYGTTYPLEKSQYWTDGTIVAHEEFVYYDGEFGADSTPAWTLETFTFTATSGETWVGFGALTNCVPDWYSSSLTNGAFATSGFTPGPADTQGYVVTWSSSTSVVYPPPEVHADNQNSGDGGWNWADQCFYGPGVSDITISGPNAVRLTQ